MTRTGALALQGKLRRSVALPLIGYLKISELAPADIRNAKLERALVEIGVGQIDAGAIRINKTIAPDDSADVIKCTGWIFGTGKTAVLPLAGIVQVEV